MRSFDETVTIEEMYAASDYLEWLASQEEPHETEDQHWNRVFAAVDTEYWQNRSKREPCPW